MKIICAITSPAGQATGTFHLRSLTYAAATRTVLTV